MSRLKEIKTDQRKKNVKKMTSFFLDVMRPSDGKTSQVEELPHQGRVCCLITTVMLFICVTINRKKTSHVSHY